MSRLSTHYDNSIMGKRIAQVRHANHLSQSEFAVTVGISPRAYAGYGRGEREPPAALLTALQANYNIDVNWILSGPGDTPVSLAERPIDGSRLELIVELIEQWLLERKKSLSPQKKGRLVRLAYEYGARSGDLDQTHLKNMLELTL